MGYRRILPKPKSPCQNRRFFSLSEFEDLVIAVASQATITYVEYTMALFLENPCC